MTIKRTHAPILLSCLYGREDISFCVRKSTILLPANTEYYIPRMSTIIT
jgi:hypothetical protein